MVTARALALAIATTSCLVTCALDPTQDDAVADLGDEAPGVPPGPTHRAGQPCLVCHDGSTASPAMSVAGTAYGVLGANAPLRGASVVFTDVNGATTTATTNDVGNFWVPASAWQPTYPLHAAVQVGDVQATMSSIIGRDGSCAGCHVDPPSRVSPGPVYLVPSAALLPDGGAK